MASRPQPNSQPQGPLSQNQPLPANGLRKGADLKNVSMMEHLKRSRSIFECMFEVADEIFLNADESACGQRGPEHLLDAFLFL
jgi:hypothetical protein